MFAIDLQTSIKSLGFDDEGKSVHFIRHPGCLEAWLYVGTETPGHSSAPPSRASGTLHTALVRFCRMAENVIEAAPQISRTHLRPAPAMPPALTSAPLPSNGA